MGNPGSRPASCLAMSQPAGAHRLYRRPPGGQTLKTPARLRSAVLLFVCWLPEACSRSLRAYFPSKTGQVRSRTEHTVRPIEFLPSSLLVAQRCMMLPIFQGGRSDRIQAADTSEAQLWKKIWSQSGGLSCRPLPTAVHTSLGIPHHCPRYALRAMTLAS